MAGSAKPAFTLAELLIAIAVLGMITVFTLPKIISSQQSSKKQLIFKETFATMSQLAYKAKLESKMNSITEWNQYVLNNVNAMKICPTNSGTEGCRTSPYAWDGTEPGFTLSNGAFVSLATWRDCGTAPYQGVAFYLDWNGNEGANTLGDDMITLITVVYTGYTQPRGMVTVYCNPIPAEQGMYQAMFQ